MVQVSQAILRLTDGVTEVDLLGPGSGWRLADPSWRPRIAQYKDGGHFADSRLADGRALVYSRYQNVVETIRLAAYGPDQDRAIKTIRQLLRLLRQAGDYWKESYEYSDVWLEARPACNDCFTGYSRVVQGSVAELGEPFGQPFYSDITRHATMEDLTLVVEREPFWRGTAPGTIIGPLYNLLRNPDFELWDQEPGAVTDVQPDNWDDLETLWITGTNNREDSAVHGGQYCLRVEVRGSTLAGATKGVTQAADDTRDRTTYTAVARVRSNGVSNGVGRILVTYADQFELYRSASRHGWTLYARSFTTGTGDVVAMNCEILTTGANTDGTVWFDSLMLLEGDWVDEANDGVLPYISASHIVNHWDQPGHAVVDAGDVNWVDAWDVPGDVDALVRVEVVNNEGDAVYPPEYGRVRVGMRRTNDVLEFDNYHDPQGVVDLTASSGDRLESGALGSAWTDLSTHLIIGGNNARNNEGRYRVLARFYDARSSGNPTLEARLKYWLGAAGTGEVELTGVPAPLRAQWVALDLTPRAAVAMDAKHSPDPPGQLGYTVQVRRTLGSDVSYLDYVMSMPTDGGYLDAELDPPLTHGNALVADGTASWSVKSTTRRAGWLVDGRLDPVTPRGRNMLEYKSDLYLAGLRYIPPSAIPYAIVWRRRAGTWSEVFLHYTAPRMIGLRALEVYNGVLYAGGTRSAAPTRILSTTDGVSWTEAHTAITAGETLCSSLRAFDGLLWAGFGASIETFDGTTWAVNRAVANNVVDMAVYRGQLFAIVDSAFPSQIDVYRPGSGWSVAYTDAARNLIRMTVFQGRLFVGTGVAGEVLIYDGFSWTAVTVAAAGLGVRSLAEYNGRLYALLIAGDVYVSDDGEDWEQAYDILGTAGWNIGKLLAYDGSLFLTIDLNEEIYSLSDSDTAYKVSDYRGRPFLSPPETRHRFVFSYDRDDGSNEVDDKALVGLGFVPRYLALRGRG